MAWFFLESLALLAVVLFLINFFLLVMWRRGGSPRPLMVMLAVSALLVGVSLFVETRRETAKAAFDAVAADLLRSRLDAFEARLARDFMAEGMDAGEFLDLARGRLAELRIISLRRMDLTVVESRENDFDVSVSYLAELAGDRYTGPLLTGWRVTFAREPDGWKIHSLELTRLGGQPVGGLRAVPR